MTRIDLRTWRTGDDPPRANQYHALLDGEDVTSGCFLADDVTGEVGLYLRDANGHFYVAETVVDDMSAAHEFRKGIVTLIPPER